VFPPSIRENSPGRLAPRDRRLGKWTALLAGCLLRVGRPDGARREARLAYLRGPNIYIAKLIEALAAHRLAQEHRRKRCLHDRDHLIRVRRDFERLLEETRKAPRTVPWQSHGVSSRDMAASGLPQNVGRPWTGARDVHGLRCHPGGKTGRTSVARDRFRRFNTTGRWRTRRSTTRCR
jgi:hypothetical protein